ncbi:protein AmbA [Agaricicola taiwanensis]|uniref:Protein AmbA n=1 Tax=Agaricicola taiwanensis TaxID=591372 RepID=A0A8J3E0S6_9RHOB|nr:LysE family translocator [Agaricicola taiwanensis]GGE54691.1 protein AmbA [Agaricicola taiwanensis]
MSWTWIFSVFVFAVAMTTTPGPNNTMLTASGANYGFRRSLPHIFGITFGVTFILLIAGAFGAQIMANESIHAVLKWVGAAYLLYLAWKIATAQPKGNAAGQGGAARGRPLTFFQAAAFQLVNPKFWAMAAGAIVTYVGSAAGSAASAVTLAIIFGLVSVPSCMAWTMVGVGAGRLLQTPRAIRVFNWAMAALLVASIAPIVLE